MWSDICAVSSVLCDSCCDKSFVDLFICCCSRVDRRIDPLLFCKTFYLCGAKAPVRPAASQYLMA